jgi:FAD:protein FMN transferase
VTAGLSDSGLADSGLAAADFPALGTTAVVVVTNAERLDEGRAVLARVLADVDAACSRFRDDSELMHVNARAGEAVSAGPLLLDAVDVALRAARLTGGDVDPTLGRVLRVLGYDRDFAELTRDADRSRPQSRQESEPESGTAPPARPAPPTVARIPGWRAVTVDRAAGTVRIPKGVELDLGATAKALAADRAAAAIRYEIGGGVLVGLGGDIAVAGEAPNGGWAIRVTDDHAAADDAPGETVSIASGGLATSSTTVRRWQRGPQEMHHVVDPATGAPATGCWRTVSVAAATCVDANIATTAAIVRGEDAPSWLASRGLPARLVRHDGRVVHVGGWPAPDPAPNAGEDPA